MQRRILPYGTKQEIKPTTVKSLMCLEFVLLAKVKCSYLVYTLKVRITLPSLNENKHSLLKSVYILKYLKVTVWAVSEIREEIFSKETRPPI